MANGALVARAPHEPRKASTLASCLVGIRCHVSGFAAELMMGRAVVGARIRVGREPCTEEDHCKNVRHDLQDSFQRR